MKLTRPTLALAAAALVLGSGAAPAYAGGVDRDCPEFASLEELTTYVAANPGDPSGLDANNNGVACENDFPPGAPLVDPEDDSDNEDEDEDTMQGGGAMPSGGVATGEARVGNDNGLIAAGGAAVLAGTGLLVAARRRAQA